MVINNNIYYHAIILATWRIGCKVSTGDTALDQSAIKFQVGQKSSSLSCNTSNFKDCFDLSLQWLQIEETGAKLVICEQDTSEKVKHALHMPYDTSAIKFKVGQISCCYFGQQYFK